MKTKSKEVIIKDIEYDTLYGNSINNEIYYVYKIETNRPLNLNAFNNDFSCYSFHSLYFNSCVFDCY